MWALRAAKKVLTESEAFSTAQRREGEALRGRGVDVCPMSHVAAQLLTAQGNQYTELPQTAPRSRKKESPRV